MVLDGTYLEIGKRIRMVIIDAYLMAYPKLELMVRALNTRLLHLDIW
jgi:hypothetical protein